MNFNLTSPKNAGLTQTARYFPGLLFIIILNVSGCNSSGIKLPETTFSGFTMGTTYHIRLVDSLLNDSAAENIKAGIDQLLLTINESMSTYIDSSEISRFNQSKLLTPLPISPAFANVLKASLDINHRSHGALDITVMPLVNFYGFGFQKGSQHLPSQRQLDSLLALTGSEHLHLTDTTVAKDISNLSIDLSAIAKGYGVDALADYLNDKGFSNVMVEIGGEVSGRGFNSEGQPWQIGIDRPQFGEQPGEAMQRIIKLRNRAIATSGDYRNYREIDGTRISHTIDPRTGLPINHRLASVSIIAPNCMLADGRATAVMVLGPRKGLDYLESTPATEGLLVLREKDGGFREYMTSGFKDYLVQ